MERESCGLDRSAGLWAISARTRSDKLHVEGGEKAAAAAAQQQAVTFGTVTVQCSVDMEDVIGK